MVRKARARQNAVQDDVYEMEAIIDYRVNKGGEEFKVKWKGYSLDECTWEPPANILGPSDEQIRAMEKLRRAAVATSPQKGTTPLRNSAQKRGLKRKQNYSHQMDEESGKGEGRCIVQHIGKGSSLASRDYEVTLRWENGHEEKQNVQLVRKMYPEELLDYLLSRVRFRDDKRR